MDSIIAGDLTQIDPLAEIQISAFIIFVAGFPPSFRLAVPVGDTSGRLSEKTKSAAFFGLRFNSFAVKSITSPVA